MGDSLVFARAVARFAGSTPLIYFLTWGLRPRLYASACFAGLESTFVSACFAGLQSLLCKANPKH